MKLRSENSQIGQEQVACFPVPDLASRAENGNSQMETATANTISSASA